MIRAITIAALASLLLLVLYLPSAHPPQRFLAHIRAEHEQLARLWSSSRAEHILARALSTQALANALAPGRAPSGAQSPSAFDSAVANEMTAVNARLFNSPYFRSVDALLMLATYRLFTLMAWIPWLAPFAAVVALDALMVRSIKAKQLRSHDPEVFAACVAAAVLLALGTSVMLVVPATLPTLLLPAIAASLALLAASSARNFHARGW